MVETAAGSLPGKVGMVMAAESGSGFQPSVKTVILAVQECSGQILCLSFGPLE